MKRCWPLLPALVLLALCVSCSPSPGAVKQPEGNAGEDAPPSPVTLTLYMQSAFPIQNQIMDIIHNKYPHITIRPLLREKGQMPEDLLAAGTFPDIIYASTPWYTDYLDLKVLLDLNELTKLKGLDVGKLDPLAIDAIKMWGEKGELYALPIYRNFAVTYYNKDLFDKFGVPYPKDGMTWKQAIEIAKTMTRKEDNVEYKGLDASESYSAVSALSTPFVKPDGKANLLQERFALALQNLKEIYGIPGNRPGINVSEFYKGTVAMSVFWNVIASFEEMSKNGTPLNWDMVTTPTYDAAPGKSFQVDSHNLSISAHSIHKEEAFQVIAYLLSKEVQADISKNGYLPSLADPDLEKVFGANLQSLKGKNVSAIFKQQSAPLYKITRYDSIVMGELGKAMNEVLDNQKDVNSALREANERADKAIEQVRKP